MTSQNTQQTVHSIPSGDDLHAPNARNDYYFRLLLALAAVGTLFQVAPWDGVNQYNVFIVLWLAYPHAVYAAITRYFDKYMAEIMLYAGFADAALVGILIGVLDLTLLPACMFF